MQSRGKAPGSKDFNGITTIEIRRQLHYGYTQGWKVYINGYKYPRKVRHFYTCMDPMLAMETAISEYRADRP